MKNLFMCVVIAFMGLTSCSSDDDNGSTGSREIKYEITGDFSGEKLDVTYTTNGGGTNTEVFDLPWAMTFTADNDTHGAGFSVMGMDATPGEKITLKVYKGDSVLKSLEATADSDGTVIGTISATF